MRRATSAAAHKDSSTILPMVRRKRKRPGRLSSSLQRRQQHHLPFRVRPMQAFAIFSVTFLVSVHVYLFRHVSIHRETADSPPPVKVVAGSNKNAPAAAAAVHPQQLDNPIDWTQFTVRINTWKREEQLRLSIDHYLSCPGVAQIQVVWCVAQGPLPVWLDEHAKQIVVVEEHVDNTLSERFHLLTRPPTAAVLSVDDDVLRPCIALAAGFDKWTSNPDRMVGFDARTHQEGDDEKWLYGYMSTTERTNQYSTTLTRHAFLHRDYLSSYFSHMPASIRETVNKNMNCEDIAMSLWVSALTGGRPPLLADYWAVKAQIKLYSAEAISSGHDHKKMRDECVNDFSDTLHLKDRLQRTVLFHKTFFEYGAAAENWNKRPSTVAVPLYIQEMRETVERWKKGGNEVLMLEECRSLIRATSANAYKQGLIVDTQPWKKRFHKEQEKL